ncbi:MAG TPA: hypothetical protein VJS16_01335 [Gammaproteobacteria bacterium]|nr:hypothetical protein [Gammaproteobacteria bacterium]
MHAANYIEPACCIIGLLIIPIDIRTQVSQAGINYQCDYRRFRAELPGKLERGNHVETG